jgi:hypothetical protein
MAQLVGTLAVHAMLQLNSAIARVFDLRSQALLTFRSQQPVYSVVRLER